MSENRIFKTIFTLKSGKSIVSSMFEEECFNIYNQWIKYSNKKDDMNNDDKIIIKKKKDNKLVEVTAIKVDEIIAIQINVVI